VICHYEKLLRNTINFTQHRASSDKHLNVLQNVKFGFVYKKNSNM